MRKQIPMCFLKFCTFLKQSTNWHFIIDSLPKDFCKAKRYGKWKQVSLTFKGDFFTDQHNKKEHFSMVLRICLFAVHFLKMWDTLILEPQES